MARPSSMFVPEWPPKPPSAVTITAMESDSAADRSPSRRTHVSVLPAQPTVNVPSSSLSRLSRIFPVSSAGSRPLAPSRPTSSATVISSSRGPCGSDGSSASAIMAAIATPSSAPSVVPSAVSHSSSRSRAIRPSAGSLGESGLRSHTMSRCPWSTTVGADSRPAVAGTRMTMLRAASSAAFEAARIRPALDVRDHRLLVPGRPGDRRQLPEALPERSRLQPAQHRTLYGHLAGSPHTGDRAAAASTTAIAPAMKSTGVSSGAATTTASMPAPRPC